jgi:chromosome segregation ATPase
LFISRISLLGDNSFHLQLPYNESSDSTGMIVVSGPNGSGKSLLTLGLDACFANDADREALIESLTAAGVQQVEVDFIHRDWNGQLVLRIPDTEPVIQWQRHPAADVKDDSPQDESPEDFDVSELFRAVNLIRSGKAVLPDLEQIQQTATIQMRAPLEHKLGEWSAIEKELAGADGLGGRLREVKAVWEKAAANLTRVEQLEQDLETARNRHSDLMNRIGDAQTQRDILAAESEAMNRLCVMSDRAMRLDKWIGEIREESRSVQRLREQHAELQERLDELERRFRGVPENFASLLGDYRAALGRERQILDGTSSARNRSAQTLEELREIEAELQSVTLPRTNDMISRREAISREIENTNLQITELLRNRIELTRKRDSLQQQLRHNFQPFVELSGEIRNSLAEFLSREDEAESAPSEVPQAQNSIEQLEARATALRSALRNQFAGFELLPPSSANMMGELLDLRHTFGTLSADLEGLKKRSSLLRHKTGHGRSIAWSLFSGALVFSAGTALFTWDIGLLAGLLVSGITLLVFQYLYRRIEQEIESAVSAEAMTQRRYDSVREAMTRLERVLRPLAGMATQEEAAMQISQFQTLSHELEDVEASIGESRAAPPVAVIRESDPDILRHLLESLAHMPLDMLRRMHADFVTLDSELAQLNDAWSGYAEGGAQAEQLRNLERRIANLQQEQSELSSEIERQNQTYLLQRTDLLTRRAALEEALTGLENVAKVENELAEIRARLNTLDRESGGLLRGGDVESLFAEWRERDELRIRLREIRDSLSARQSHDELRARESLLSEELAQVKRRLSDLDPLYLLQGTTADYSAKYAGQFKALEQDMHEADEFVRRLQIEAKDLDIAGLTAALEAEPDAATLRQNATSAQLRFETVERELAEARNRISGLRAELDKVGETTGPDLSEAINRQVQIFSGNRFSEVQFKDDQWFAVGADGSVRAFRNLSDGTCDLLWLAIRTAILEFLQASDDSPVVWDEALSRLDEQHLTAVRVALVRIAAHRQVLLLTRHASFEWWGPSVKLSA